MPLLNLESGADGCFSASGCSASETMRNPHGVYSHWVHLHAAHCSAVPPRPRWQSPCCSGWCNLSGIMRGITRQPMAAGQVYDRGKTGCIGSHSRDSVCHVLNSTSSVIPPVDHSPHWLRPPLNWMEKEWTWNIMWKMNIDDLMVL